MTTTSTAQQNTVSNISVKAKQAQATPKLTNRPFCLQWQGKDYFITGVTGYHTEPTGDNQITHIFIATSDSDHFELRFTGEQVAWFLGD